MLLKKWLHDYFVFSRRDRWGILALLLLIFLVYWLPRRFARPSSATVEELALVKAATDSLHRQNLSPQAGETGSVRTEALRPFARLFPFDPNTLSLEGWQQLGLRERTARTILNYRGKGGRFRRPEDPQKIWGLPPGFYERVAPLIRLPEQQAAAGYEVPRREAARAGQIERVPPPVDVNRSDSADWIALPGIGERLARRILNFREKLGGFWRIEQVAETYGLPDSTFRAIRPRLVLSGGVRKLPVNTATKEELKNHPYLRWTGANALVNYRTQHGPFKSLDELKNISLFSDSLYQQLLPYLLLEDGER